jgi:hypothetical protein
MTKAPISNATTVIEVHNAYTVYSIDEDGREAEVSMLQFSRPQDWGDPRWRYERFKLEWITDDRHYINHVHCWTDLSKLERGYPSLFIRRHNRCVYSDAW